MSTNAPERGPRKRVTCANLHVSLVRGSARPDALTASVAKSVGSLVTDATNPVPGDASTSGMITITFIV